MSGVLERVPDAEHGGLTAGTRALARPAVVALSALATLSLGLAVIAHVAYVGDDLRLYTHFRNLA